MRVQRLAGPAGFSGSAREQRNRYEPARLRFSEWGFLPALAVAPVGKESDEGFGPLF